MKGPSSGSEAGKKKGGGIFFFSPLFILFRTSVDLMMAMCIRMIYVTESADSNTDLIWKQPTDTSELII